MRKENVFKNFTFHMAQTSGFNFFSSISRNMWISLKLKGGGVDFWGGRIFVELICSGKGLLG